jgi:asparagine synthase (glutamine-hydrolysing)
MAEYLKHEWLFKALDNGLWLLDLEDITERTGGNVLYYGIAHGNSLFKYMDFSSLGALHSGQMGDVVLATNSGSHEEFVMGDGAYSKRFIDYLSKRVSLSFKNREIGKWYTRYLNGANNGQQNGYNYTETVSPFLQLDFLQFCLSIPAKYRENHYIYKKWILKKYPDAANFEWESIGLKINALFFKFMGREIYWKSLLQRVCRRISIILLGNNAYYNNSKKNMNPLGYYINHNPELMKFVQSYFENLDLLPISGEIKEVIDDINKDGSGVEKIQCVTLLSALRRYYM